MNRLCNKREDILEKDGTVKKPGTFEKCNDMKMKENYNIDLTKGTNVDNDDNTSGTGLSFIL